jgi:hypothetical protein
VRGEGSRPLLRRQFNRNINYLWIQLGADFSCRQIDLSDRKGKAGIMKKLIKVAPKREGRPSTRGRDPHVAAGFPSTLIAEVEAWAVANNTSRSDAFRQLVELGLARTKSVRPISAKSAKRARQIAAKTIDGLVDAAAPAEESANRKRRLLKGPEEFREVRVDSGKETRSGSWSD